MRTPLHPPLLPKGLRALCAKLKLETRFDLLYYLPKNFRPVHRIDRLEEVVSLPEGELALCIGRLRLEAGPASQKKPQWKYRFFSEHREGVGTVLFFHRPWIPQGPLIALLTEVKRQAAQAYPSLWVHPKWIPWDPVASEPAFKVIENNWFLPIYSKVPSELLFPFCRFVEQQLEALRSPQFPPPPWSKYFDDLIAWERYLPALHGRFASRSEMELWREGQHPAQKRLVLEEATAMHLAFKRNDAAQGPSVLKPFEAPQEPAWEPDRFPLPFALREDQIQAVKEILKDCSSRKPMKRLLLGEVGSGKTVVAALASLWILDQGGQVAFIAPNLSLCLQHYRTFLKLWPERAEAIDLLIGDPSLPETKKTRISLAADPEKPRILIATHAVFFIASGLPHLRLIIFDESQKFGVSQRLKLLEGAGSSPPPHQLFMTATPIPRSLAMIQDGRMALSRLLPNATNAARQTQITRLISKRKIPELLNRLNRWASQPGETDPPKLYWVCPLIQSQESGVGSIEERFESLKSALPGFQLLRLEGRMNAKEQQAVLALFSAPGPAVLVCTTAAEVGLDIQDANLVVIEDAERFGMTQIHQLRGRVGRMAGSTSFCLLLHHDPQTPEQLERLATLRTAVSGEQVAQKDLTLRGPGGLFSYHQSGWDHSVRYAKRWMPWEKEALRQEVLTRAAAFKAPEDLESFLKLWPWYEHTPLEKT